LRHLKRGKGEVGWDKVSAMNIKRKLLNPFVLGAQGFVAGAILFWSTYPSESEAPQPAASAHAPAVQQIAGI
jgi:hypothetical protein